jgi:hypothetical protein
MSAFPGVLSCKRKFFSANGGRLSSENSLPQVQRLTTEKAPSQPSDTVTTGEGKKRTDKQ